MSRRIFIVMEGNLNREISKLRAQRNLEEYDGIIYAEFEKYDIAE